MQCILAVALGMHVGSQLQLVLVGTVMFTKLHGLQRFEFHDLSWHVYFAHALDMLLCL